MARERDLTVFVVRLLTTAVSAVIVGYLLPGIRLDSFMAALLLAAVLAILNAFVKPLLIFLTLPFTILTFGLFLIVVNALIILLAQKLVPGFYVAGFWWAVLFSIILSVVVAAFDSLTGNR
ncbi:MAG TPA: phage holin family protein [Bacteroidia bacterium]|nr:phage holin family protein [Bacteroidia bacterium]